MTEKQLQGERYRAWLKVQEGRADECVNPRAVRRLAAEYEGETREVERLRELLEQAEVDTERKVGGEMRGRLEKAHEALRTIQAVAVMAQNHHAEKDRLEWLREIENHAREARLSP
jgi:hypothetical protein